MLHDAAPSGCTGQAEVLQSFFIKFLLLLSASCTSRSAELQMQSTPDAVQVTAKHSAEHQPSELSHNVPSGPQGKTVSHLLHSKAAQSRPIRQTIPLRRLACSPCALQTLLHRLLQSPHTTDSSTKAVRPSDCKMPIPTSKCYIYIYMVSSKAFFNVCS